MQSRKSVVRAIAALAAAAACAVAFDAAVVLADAPPTTRPVQVVPSTQPLFVGGTVSNNYATLDQPRERPPVLMSSRHGGSSTDAPATIDVGGGVAAGQTQAAGTSSNTGVAPIPTTRPSTR